MQTTGVAEDTIVKVQTAPDGSVWYLDGSRTPQASRLGPEGFASSEVCRGARRIRALGSRDNVDLIVNLYRAAHDDGTDIELGSPSLVGRDQADPPDDILYRMRHLDSGVAASIGGWHRMTPADFSSYAIAWGLSHGNHRAVETAMEQHPAWPSLSFISHLNRDAASRTIADVLDPRWFIDPEDPSRISRLKNFLGLDPKTARSNRDDRPRDVRYRSVLASWKSGPIRDDLILPGEFLWRHWRVVCGRLGPDTADLRTCQHFVAYLKATWTEGLYAGARPLCESLFTPEHFFRGEIEARAYRDHVASLSAGP